MDSYDLIRHQTDTSLKQLKACLKDLPNEAGSIKLTDQGMTIEDIIQHLGDCYTAILQGTDGYDWGSFQSAKGELAEKSEEILGLRAKALDKLFADPDQIDYPKVTDFIVLHDAYHVGQLVLCRLIAEPGWNHYSIYE